LRIIVPSDSNRFHLRRHKPAQRAGARNWDISSKQERDGPQQSDRRPQFAQFHRDGHWTSTLAILQKGDYLLVSSHERRGIGGPRAIPTPRVQDLFHQICHRIARPRALFPSLCQPSTRNTWTGTTFREGPLTDYAPPCSGWLRRSCSLHRSEKKTRDAVSEASADLLQQFNIQPGQATHFQEMGRDHVAKTDRPGYRRAVDRTPRVVHWPRTAPNT